MTYLVDAKTMTQIVQMLSDGVITNGTATKVLRYYEAKKRMEIGEATEHDIEILREMHNI